jgi:hypothetical protein
MLSALNNLMQQDSFILQPTLPDRHPHHVVQILQLDVFGRDQPVAAVDAVEDDGVVAAALSHGDDGVLHAGLVPGDKHHRISPHARLELPRPIESEPLRAQRLKPRGLGVRELLGVAPALDGLEHEAVLRARGEGGGGCVFGCGGRKRDARDVEGWVHFGLSRAG